MPFSQKSYRQINKLKIIGTVPNSDPYKAYYSELGVKLGETDIIFSAYTAQGMSFQADVQTGGGSNPITDGKYGSLFKLGFNLAGKSPSFDYPRKFLYSGTKPMSWTLDCYLTLDDAEVYKDAKDPQDILDQAINFPIRRLLGLYLPNRDENGSITGILRNSFSGFNIPYISQAINQGLNKAEGFLGQVYPLTVPFPYNVTDDAIEKQLTFVVGGIKIKPIVITGVVIKLPPFTYENGLPDHVDLSISFETLRPATTTSFGSFFSNKDAKQNS